jgi:signal transduction histidine kinase
VTQRKAAEEDVHDLSRKLMGAQEKERARLARELHDDLSQSLALLSIQLEMLGREPNEPSVLKRKIGEFTSHIQRLSTDLHRISHELHPSKLNQLGLESALRGFCREITATYGIKVEFDAANVPRTLPNDVSLCLYRIVQESLQNVFKHSGASVAIVSIRRVGNEIRLTVSDNGSGFDPQAARSKESLGLVSMDERMRAVNGSISIDSTIGAGTQIVARAAIKR